jgi:tRNA (adenine57-N1/adenine58-N1)-methyltransferase
MNTRQRYAQKGQTIIVYAGRDNLHLITLTAGQMFNNKYGHFKHEQFIGAPFGKKVFVTIDHSEHNWFFFVFF